ncbi:hypothetical protein [Bacillus atrophaeus]|uniref:hypothetical protein n=1 Tax=Bacillus atrophaeus TaxID=1452 RepID=UPI001C62DB22|nr:hypothetical protein [Bacillus atrophaeus]MCY8489353.1 hypothetical protein [Bacillus atrophaeus]MCY8816757.1 hypothetical protein [Bacillus atrophaeus]MED4805818.1 hypothetical protein [Bacillus atrophaeus]MED4817596.1 hypothetical protein [Bacillus atrophaeus]MED4825761.1 hypothetical protein [Bacillus atrophaeus]
MSLYSIEQGAEQIYHPKTKEYFKEVLQSYVNGSYRSAVVMLYSVVMCDLIYKLKDLKELYEDETAISILEKVEEEQKKNTTNPGSWEGILIDEVKTRTLLLEPADKITIDSLRLHRHLSAHPVLTQNDLLSTPNKETARALIRNMLEGLFIKNPVMSKKVFDTLLEDLGEHKNFFSDDFSLENYIESRYLKNTNEHMINTIFKDLWSITFNCASDQCKTNREINFRTLKILYKKYRASLLKYIEENPIPFNKFKEDNEGILLRLTKFFGDNPELYSFIESHNQTKLKAKIKSKGKLKVRAPFLRGSMENHFDYLIKDIHWEEYTYEERFYESHILDRAERELLLKWASENDCIDKYYDLLIQQFVHSGNFDTADHNYDVFIKPNLKQFNREQFLTLYDGINRNRQCHAHRFAKSNNTQIKTYSDLILGSDFDYEGEFPRVEFKEDKEQ